VSHHDILPTLERAVLIHAGYATGGTHALFQAYKSRIFFDLVNRKRLSLITHDESFVDVSVQTHAQSWGWNRKAARSFLDELSLTGTISLCSTDDKTTILLHAILVDPQHASQGSAQHRLDQTAAYASADRKISSVEPSEHPDGQLNRPVTKSASDGP